MYEQETVKTEDWPLQRKYIELEQKMVKTLKIGLYSVNIENYV